VKSLFALVGLLLKLGKDLNRWGDEPHRRNLVVWEHLGKFHPELAARIPKDQRDRFTHFFIAAFGCAARNANGCPHKVGQDGVEA